MDENTPQPQETTANPANVNCACGNKLATFALIALIVGIICSFIPFLGIFVAGLLFVVAIILSIVAIVKGGKVFGIIILCSTILVGGPVACVGSCVGTVGAAALTNPEGAINDFAQKAIEEAKKSGNLTEQQLKELEDASAQLQTLAEDPIVKKQQELAVELQKAIEAGDTAKAEAIQKEMMENAQKIAQ